MRAVRMDRGLEIRAAATLLGVTPDTLVNWEQGHHEPEPTHGASILAFLGYCPFEEPENLAGHLQLWRWKRGLSHRQAAAEIGVDPSTWRCWERGAKRPSPRSEALLSNLGISLPDSDGAQADTCGILDADPDPAP